MQVRVSQSLLHGPFASESTGTCVKIQSQAPRGRTGPGAPEDGGSESLGFSERLT